MSRTKKKTNKGKKQCKFCGKLYKRQGLNKHEQWCCKDPVFTGKPREAFDPNKTQLLTDETLAQAAQVQQEYPYLEAVCPHCGMAFELLIMGLTAKVVAHKRMIMIKESRL